MINPREQLLPRLFNLMEKSDNISTLPRERKERIKEKYRRATVGAIRNGILMLEKDIGDAVAAREKSRRALKKSTEKLMELKKMAADEKRKSEKIADDLLKGLPSPKKKIKSCPCRYVYIALFIIVAGLLVYHYVLK